VTFPATLQRSFDADQCADCDPVVEVILPVLLDYEDGGIEPSIVT
jgi:hypothetical protein